ncbi:MAG: heme NO-binding domain-containing protein [Granulosicoccus sp.]|nr:heme NO-binding domain-containing protein [Granulosicoccus sp.]
MKGVVFNLLSEMVEEKFGLEVWDALLETTGQDGVYVSTETYPDENIFALVGAASEKSGIPANDLVKAFGEYMFPHFYRQNPAFFKPDMSLKEFLLSVDRVIHVEVRKLHPDAGLPEFEYEDEHDQELTMLYSSPRKLCMLAEGLIAGAATHFDTEYTLSHNECMHDGAESCRLHLKIA